MLSRRRALQVLGGVGAAGLLGSSGCTFTTGAPPIVTVGLDKKPAPGRKHNISVYSVWGSTVGQGFVKMAEEFEKTHPDIGVRVIYAPAGVGGGSVQQKLFVAIAGDNPPDVAQLVPSQTPQWAELGIMTDLTDRFKAAGHTEEDFFGPVWESMSYRDKVWQIQWDADPNFPFFWNKKIFEGAGLDPEKPPETVEEVEEYSAKILKKKGGNVTQIGMVPWDWYGFANSMFTWGWSFGGSFYDMESDKVTPDHDNNVKALEWLIKYANGVGGPAHVAVTPPGLTLHPFSSGNIGMSPLVAPNFKDIKNPANNVGFEVGTGKLPYSEPAAGIGSGAWFGGWGMFVPRGARDPDAAFEFINWVATSDKGTQSQWKNIGFPPTYKKSPVLPVMEKDPLWKPYYDVLVSTKNARPPMLVSDFYFQNLDAEVSAAVLGTKSAGAALTAVRKSTEAEVERFRKEVMK